MEEIQLFCWKLVQRLTRKLSSTGIFLNRLADQRLREIADFSRNFSECSKKEPESFDGNPLPELVYLLLIRHWISLELSSYCPFVGRLLLFPKKRMSIRRYRIIWYRINDLLNSTKWFKINP